VKISIITVCFNSESVIKCCLESVATQKYEDKEHVVIDGGSIDGTISHIKEYRDGISVFLSEKDNGIYDALNKGISLSTGDVIGILHADDFFFNDDVLSEVALIFKAKPYLKAVSGNSLFFKDDTSKITRNYGSRFFRSWMMRFGFMPSHTASFFHKDVFRTIGGYDTSYGSAGDFEFYLRLFKSPLPHLYSDINVTKMREGGLSTSGWSSYWRTTKEIKRALNNQKIFTFWLFVLMRLPIKLVSKYLFR